MPPTVTFGKWISAADKAVLGRGADVARFDLDLSAELFEHHEQKIDRPRADGAAARQRYAGFAHAGDERRDDPEACPHLGDEIIGRGGVDDIACREMQGAAGMRVIAGAAAVDAVIDAVMAEDLQQHADIGDTRDIFERQRLPRQHRCDHQRQRRVLGTRDGNRPLKRVSAYDPDAIHLSPLIELGRRVRLRGCLCPILRTCPVLDLPAAQIFPQRLRQARPLRSFFGARRLLFVVGVAHRCIPQAIAKSCSNAKFINVRGRARTKLWPRGAAA